MKKIYILTVSLITLLILGCASFPGSTVRENVIREGELPWEKNPFTASYQQLKSAADNAVLEDEKGVRILLHEGYFKFDDSGSLESKFKWVYEILDQSGIENWSSTQVAWTPWNQTRPEIKVRVTNPDGKSHFLSKEHIVERAERSESSNIYSDRMILRAPFPRVTVGSIIEEEITLNDSLPRFDTGITKTWYFEGSHPIFMNRVIIDVPENLPFNYRIFKKNDLKPVISSMEKTKRYIFEYSEVSPAKKIEPGIPIDEPHWVKLSFSTGESWNKVASVYNMLVEEKISVSDFSSDLNEVSISGDAFASAVSITEWLNKKIRYTGLELGENSIVPTLPSETLSRGFGDCKDKAVIVTGMLRKAGFDAHVALLRAGASEDIDPNLPGLGGFNHAIVYVGGSKPFWIDPTSEFSYNGYLPLSDQGRWALIISPKTRDVIKTSISESKDNRTVKDIVYTMKDTGYADVEESIFYYGADDSYYRSRYLFSKKEDIEKSFDEYIKAAYRFGERESLFHSDPEDFTTPFHISLKIKGAGRGITEEVSGFAAIMQGEIVNRLPEVFTYKNDDDELRVNKYSFYQPFMYIKKYVIHIPTGFVPRKVPESEFIKLGTVSLTKKFAVTDNIVEVTLALDSGKKVITPLEFEETKKAVLDFKDEKPIILNFEHIGYKMLADGNYKESIGEFKKYCDLEKDKAIHWIRLAGALLQAGLGDDAKKAALKAVELDPESAEGYGKLAWVLQHDGLGRRFMPGYDKAGAIEAYHKAIDLDPDNWLYHANLAILEEYDEYGMRYSDEADLDDAIENYKATGEKLAEKGMELNLISDYFYSGRFKELLDLLDKVKNQNTASLYRVISYAAMGDLEKAFSEAEKSTNAGEKRKLLSDAGDMLVRIRKYPEVAALFKKAAKGSEDALSLETRSATFEKTIPYEKILFDLSNPEDVVKKFMKELYLSRGEKFNGIEELVTPSVYKKGIDPEAVNGFKKEWFLLRKQSISSGISLKAILDLLLADMKFQTEKDSSGGYHLKLVQTGLGINLDSNYYLIKEGNSYRIAGTDDFITVIGPVIENYVTSGRLETAKTWLDWFIKDYSIYNRDNDDPLYGHPVQQFWKKHGKKTPDTMKYAAAAIEVMDKDYAEKGVEILKQGRSKAVKESQLKSFDYALYFGYQTLEDLPLMYSTSGKLFEIYPESDFAWSSYLDALLRNNKGEELLRVTASRLKEDPTDSISINILINYYFSQMNFSKVDEIFSEQLKANRETARLYNAVAWMDLFKPSSDKKGLEYARKAVNLSNGRSEAILHTLASQYAEAGRCREARNTLDEVIRLSGNDDPSSDDWYVLGRIAEEYGMMDSAVEYYEKVEKPELEVDLYNSAYVLARRRLEKIGKVR